MSNEAMECDSSVASERHATLMVKELAQELALQAERCNAWSWGNEYGDGLRATLSRAFEPYGFDLFECNYQPAKRVPLTDAEKNAIYARDGKYCRWCRAEQDLTIDHIHPVSLGGLNDPSNLQVLCRSCNSWKGDRVE